MAESSNHFNSSLLCHFFKARQLLPSVDGRRSDFYSPINPSIKTQMPATDITAVCQCTVSMATDFVQNLLCCAALCFPFQRCPHTRGTHHSSHRAEWLKPQRDSWNCFFLAEANSDLWEKREDGDQPRDGAEWSKGRRCAVFMTQWTICLCECGRSEATEVLPGASLSLFFDPHLPHNGPIV